MRDEIEQIKIILIPSTDTHGVTDAWKVQSKANRRDGEKMYCNMSESVKITPSFHKHLIHQSQYSHTIYKASESETK